MQRKYSRTPFAPGDDLLHLSGLSYVSATICARLPASCRQQRSLRPSRSALVAATVLGGFASTLCGIRCPDVLRHGTRFDMTETASAARGLLAHVDRLARTRLYEARLLFDSRDRRAGWMQLELRARRRKSVRLDSRIEGFDQSWSCCAAAAAETRGHRAERGDRSQSGGARGQLTPRQPGCPANRREPPMRRSAECPRPARPFATPGGFIRAVTGGVVPRAAAIDRGAGRRIRLRQVGGQPGILRILPRNGEITRGEILFADPRARRASRSTSSSCRPTARRCGRSAAAGSRSSSRSR